jgi:carboxyl-terminal processing protease
MLQQSTESETSRHFKQHRTEFLPSVTLLFVASHNPLNKVLMKLRTPTSLVLAVIGLIPALPQARAETDFGQVAIYVADMLERQHYSHLQFDNAMSGKLLENYLNLLDGRHIFFTQQDVDTFARDYKIKLDDFVMLRDISPATNIYAIFKERVKGRVAFVKSLLDGKQKFNFKDAGKVDLKRDKLPWPADKAASDQLWRDLIENEMLEEHLAALTKKEREAEKKAKADSKPKDEKSAEKDGQAKADSTEKPAKETAAAEVKKPKTPEETIIDTYEKMVKDLEDNDTEDQVNYFLTCLASAYDPHTDYMSKRESDAFEQQMTHRLYGIGAQLEVEDDVAKIQGIIVGGPADKNGELQPDDQILGVAQGNGEYVETKFMKLTKIVDMIRGNVGTTVRLKIRPASDPAVLTEISIVRGEVALKDSLATGQLIKTPADMGTPMKIGWIDLPSFYADMKGGQVSTTKDVEKLLRRLMAENIDGLVLDLRGNGGGSLEEAINLTGLFIPSGPVVQVKDWRGEITFRESPSRNALYTGPMIVMTDKTSASASEILAGALQDYRRAIIIGDESTFGKGTVQTIAPVEKHMPFFADKTRAGNLKVTIQKFYRISGGSTQLQGVVPDLQLPSVRNYMDFGEASYENPMPYDQIPAVPYNIVRPKGFALDELRNRLTSRLANNPDFSYVNEEARRYKERLDKNALSLNEDEREAERKAAEERRRAYEKDREARTKQLTEAKKGAIETLFLTLDSPDFITEENYTKEGRSGIKAGKKTKDAEGNSVEPTKIPYGTEPYKLEALHVLRDMIELENGSPTTAQTKP